jgi:hypothetical protein
MMLLFAFVWPQVMLAIWLSAFTIPGTSGSILRANSGDKPK